MLGDTLKALREKMGLSQKAFAKKYDINASTLASYELEKREPNIDMLIRFSKIYGVSIDYLLGNAMPGLDDYENAINQYGNARLGVNGAITQILNSGTNLDKRADVVLAIMALHGFVFSLDYGLNPTFEAARETVIRENIPLLPEIQLDGTPAKKSENPAKWLYLLTYMSHYIDKAIKSKKELTDLLDEILKEYTNALLSQRFRLAQMQSEAEQEAEDDGKHH